MADSITERLSLEHGETETVSEKSYKSALVVIPPTVVWPEIQILRARHDYAYWFCMPHITLLHPFLPPELFDELRAEFARTAADLEPFDVEMGRFGFFETPDGNYVVWLDPEPNDPWRRLHEAVLAVTPDCDDTSRHPGGYRPHLTVAQCANRQAMWQLMKTLKHTWTPSRFTVARVSLIVRGEPPRDAFHELASMPLGQGEGSGEA